MNNRFFFYLLILCSSAELFAQPWQPDMGNGRYKNPIIYADYSDPDIIRSGEDFYMIASSFNCMPGIPVLHSKDLVNWKIVNYVYDHLPLEKYNKPDHGSGSWAPSIRYHNHKFYVYFCTPYDGLFVAIADNPEKKWELHQIAKVELWEDPCPVWDDDGNAWLVRSKFCGNELFLHKLSPDGLKLLDNGVSIFRDTTQPTIEGPKIFRKNSYYYILAPAGGVSNGWQSVLRSKSIYGPYEAKIVLHQGNTSVNGPHQGGLVDLDSGESWFVHFQEKPPFGRIVHLQPVFWKDSWPIIGIDNDGDGIGEPVQEYVKPNVGKSWPVEKLQTSDEFENRLGLQWQWHANPQKEWFAIENGWLRLNAVQNLTQNGNLWFSPNLLLQKFPAPVFTATTQIKFHPQSEGEKAGILVMGQEWAYIAIEKDGIERSLIVGFGKYDRCDPSIKIIEKIPGPEEIYYLRISVNNDGECRFFYSFDNKVFSSLGKSFNAQGGRWIGAKIGIFCVNPDIRQSNGFAEFNWFRVE